MRRPSWNISHDDWPTFAGLAEGYPLAARISLLETPPNASLDRLTAGEIEEFPPKLMTFMDQLS